MSSKSLPWPEDRNGQIAWLRQVWSRWTYSYMNIVLDKGSRQMLPNGTHLAQDDLFAAPPAMEATRLASLFRKYYEEERGSKRQMLRTLWRLAAPIFVPAGFCQLITVFVQVAIPLLVRELLRVLEENPSQQVIEEGLPYAVGIFVCAVVNAFATQRHRHLATKAGVLLRSAVVAVLYDNALRLSPTGRMGLTTGETTNLVGIDSQKLYEVMQEGHLIWSCPLSMCVVTAWLLVIMGPTTIVGMFVLFLFVPVVQRISAKMLVIRHERVKITDERVEAVSAMLHGIRVTKLNNYETKYQERIDSARQRELVMLRRELFVWAITLVITVLSPVVASSATFFTYALVDEDNILTASRTFTVLLLFQALRFPINYVGRLIGRAGQALEAARRIGSFLEREIREEPIAKVLEDDHDNNSEKPTPLLVMEEASFAVGTQVIDEEEKDDDDNKNSGNDGADAEQESAPNAVFTLSGVSCSVRKGEILAVVGPTGCGKSTMINGIIGEVPTVEGTMSINSTRVAYASQLPFILNATLRDNILFGLPMNMELYERVLDATCLRPDMEQLGKAGDLTEIGERGVTLSGGQKQRVSLARAAYAQPELILCDDPLSALDASTAKKMFDRLLRNDDSPLAGSAIVLVTHAAHFLNRCDSVVLLVEGKMRFRGTWTELGSYQSLDAATMVAVESIRSAVQEGEEVVEADTANGSSKVASEGKPVEQREPSTVDKQGGELMTIEEREHGLSSVATWLLWFKHAGGFPFLFVQLSLMTVDRLFYVATEVWLSLWTSAYDGPINVWGVEFPAQTEGRSAQAQYIGVFCAILVISVLATFSRSEWAVTGGARCAKNVFSRMVSSVLRAPMSYFETTPMGRILNRFTFDTEVVDLTLTEAMSVLIISSGWYVAGVCVMCSILPWVALAVGPITLVYIFLLMHYRKSGADLQRLDAVSRSPLQALLAEGMDGASTIRVYNMGGRFLSAFHNATDTNSSALLNFITAQRWLGVRIEMLGSLVVLVSTVLVVSLNDVLKLEPGLVALLIIWSSNFTITLSYLVDGFGEAEAAITSIERVHSMASLPSERDMETPPEVGLSKAWPSEGRVEFDNVCLRYRNGLPLALTGLSFVVEGGKRCGIVGRTGAGKTTVTVALFRLVELESGSIMLDGMDLSGLGLSDVRGRLSIIPQDPFLFSGTLRECIDPFNGTDDEDVLEALKAVRIAKPGAGSEVLRSRVEEGGSNYSVGERQLLCLARALLQKPKVLVMDEATASVDSETDAFIQAMLRTRFKDSTLLTVAHRLNTIMDYDTILVMDKGKAIEFGSPKDLLSQNGSFADLVDSTGPESALALRNQALGESSENYTAKSETLSIGTY
mmetsp:Transcript_7157/g.10475  ORF Transcript_7157/g.10475 Transcript_7157/m.10475 type:complete len:1354 (-) Transcript_7157:106-4167(-)